MLRVLFAFLSIALTSVAEAAKPSVELPNFHYIPGQVNVLSGQWLFVPNQFLTPNNVENWTRFQALQIPIPGPLPNLHQGSDASVWGTLLIKLTGLNRSDEDLALSLRVDSSYEAFLYSQQSPGKFHSLMKVGRPGPDRLHSIPEIADRFAPMPQSILTNEMWVVLHLSGWYFANTNVWSIPKIQSLDKTKQITIWATLSDAMAMSVLASLSVYFLGFALRQKNDRSAHWAFLLATVVCLRTFATSGQLLAVIGIEPSVWWHTVLRKMEYCPLPIQSLAGVAFVAESFFHTKYRRYIRYDSIVALSLLGLILVSPTVYLRNLLLPINLYVLLHVILGAWLSLLGSKNKVLGANSFFLAFFILLLMSAHDMGIGLGLFNGLPILIGSWGVVALIFAQGQILASKFDNALRLAARLSKNLSREVERQTEEVKSIMNTIPHGVFTIGPDQTLGTNVSRQIEKICGHKNLSGRLWYEAIIEPSLLQSDAKSMLIETVKAIINENIINFEVNEHCFPTEFSIVRPDSTVAEVEATWNPVKNKDDTIDSILVTLQDVSAKRSREREMDQKEAELVHIREIIQIPVERFNRFCVSSKRLLSEIEATLTSKHALNSETLQKVFLSAHTLKGASRTLGLKLLASAIHDMEAAIESCRTHAQKHDSSQTLIERFFKVQKIYELSIDINDRVLGRAHSEVDGVPLRKKLIEECAYFFSYIRHNVKDGFIRLEITEAARELTKQVYFDMRSIIAEASQDLKQIAKELLKSTPNCQTSGPELFIDQRGQEILSNVLVHLLRNAVDHGIEFPHERLSKGKSEAGTVQFQWNVANGMIDIHMSDDGRGLALHKITEKALSQGLISSQDTASPSAIADFIFHPNFSTAQQVTQFSGRGVGMSAVREMLSEIDGHISILVPETTQRSDFVPFEIRIRIPAVHSADIFAPENVANAAHEPAMANVG